MMLREFQSVVKLIDDQTPEVQRQVDRKLREFYFTLSPKQWLDMINDQPQHIKATLSGLYESFNKQYFRFLFNQWAGLLTDKDRRLSDWLEMSGEKVEFESSLLYLLFIVSRLLTPFLSYQELKDQFNVLFDKVPVDFMRSSTPLEQARYFVWLFYKWDRFYSTAENPLWVTFDPFMTLDRRKGSGFTIAMIMSALAEEVGLDWFVISDELASTPYVVIPVDKEWTLQPLLINAATGVILNQIPQEINGSLVQFVRTDEHRLVSAFYFLLAYLKNQFLPGSLYKLIGKIWSSLANKILNK